jgi:hypothetical protein
MMRNKKVYLVITAIFSMFLLVGTAFAGGTVELSVNDEPIQRYGTSEKAGSQTLKFLEGTVLNVGDQITMDLDIDVTNANAVDMEVSPGGDAANVVANRWDIATIPLSGAGISPVQASAGGVIAQTGDGIYFRIRHIAGGVTVTIDIMGTAGDSIEVLDATANQDYLELIFYGQRTNAVFDTDGIWVANDADGLYDDAAGVQDNTLCINVSQTEAGFVKGHYDSAGDVYVFSGAGPDPTIAHMVPPTTVIFDPCKDREPGHIDIGDRVTQGSENCGAFDNEDAYPGNRFCADHEANDIVLQAAPSFAIGNYTLSFEILVNGQSGDNGVYWTNVAPTSDGWTLKDDACAGPNDDALPAPTYLLANGSAAAAVDLDPNVNECDVDPSARAVVMNIGTTNMNLTAGDDYLGFDLPSFNYDLDDITEGDVVSVLITINKVPCGILFTGTWEIGTFGCTAPGVSNTILFPYFTNMLGDTYWDGIAIVNIGSTDGTATLTVYEADGDVATMTVNVAANSMYVNLLSAMVSGMTLTTSVDGTLGNARNYIRVTTDFNVDGFAMMARSDTGESMGYLPRTTGVH